MYRDAERRQGVARRIRELWEESGYTEEFVADTLGISISGFQKQKQTGGIRREHAEKLAELFGTTYEYIATGRDKGPTPDVLSSLNGAAQQRAEEKLDALLVLQGIDPTKDVLQQAARLVAERAAQAKKEQRRGRQRKSDAS